jgi:hypothetical protein
MHTFVSVPLVGDWVHMPSGDSLAIYAVSEIIHVPQPADENGEKAPLAIVCLEAAKVSHA